MAWLNNPPPEYQVLMARARTQADFAELANDLGWPDWRIDYERNLAKSLWEAAVAAYRAQRQYKQLRLL